MKFSFISIFSQSWYRKVLLETFFFHVHSAVSQAKINRRIFSNFSSYRKKIKLDETKTSSIHKKKSISISLLAEIQKKIAHRKEISSAKVDFGTCWIENKFFIEEVHDGINIHYSVNCSCPNEHAALNLKFLLFYAHYQLWVSVTVFIFGTSVTNELEIEEAILFYFNRSFYASFVLLWFSLMC